MNKAGRVLDELLERAWMNSGLTPDLVWDGEPDLDHLFTGAEAPRNVSTEICNCIPMHTLVHMR